MWNKTWNLKEGFTIGCGLIVAGLLLQFCAGPVVWGAFMWPKNIIALAIFIALIIAAYCLKKKVYFFKFCLSYASAVPAIAYAVVLTIIMGLTRQSESPSNEDPLGITSCLTFWPFVLIYIWIAWIVGITGLHQMMKMIRSSREARMASEARNSRETRSSQLAALFSHLGLFIVLVCGTLGSADMQRLRMYCETGHVEWRALDGSNKVHELPIAIQLDSFIIEEYPPKLTLVDNKNMTAVEVGGKPLSILVDNKFKDIKMGGWKVNVEKVLDNAAPRMTTDTTTYVEWPVNGAACAVLVKAEKADKTQRGWISCGSYRLPSQMLTLDNQYSIGMAQREPQRFASKVHLYSEKGDNVETIVEVNKPYTLMGWKIYQYSYNEQMGKWSDYSVFELVSDPWLPVVYVGIGLIAFGAFGMFFDSRKAKSSSETSGKEAEHVG